MTGARAAILALLLAPVPAAACSIEDVARVAGYRPAPGATIAISQARIDALARAYDLSAADISRAKSCVRRLGFSYRIVR